jgi:hypothetical protein
VISNLAMAIILVLLLQTSDQARQFIQAMESRAVAGNAPQSLEELVGWCNMGWSMDRIREQLRNAADTRAEAETLAVKRSNLARCQSYLTGALAAIRSRRLFIENHSDLWTPVTPPNAVLIFRIPNGTQQPEDFICLPPKLEWQQVATNVRDWAENHSRQWLGESAQVHVLAALLASYPCKQIPFPETKPD